jgi:hypothetical protein
MFPCASLLYAKEKICQGYLVVSFHSLIYLHIKWLKQVKTKNTFYLDANLKFNRNSDIEV